MVKFDADKLGEQLDALNREQFDKIDKRVDEVLGNLHKSKAMPKRAKNSKYSTNSLARKRA